MSQTLYIANYSLFIPSFDYISVIEGWYSEYTMRNLMRKYLNFTLFYFAAFFSFYETIRLTEKIASLVKVELDYLSIIPFPALKISQILTGICFIFIGLSFMSKGFKKTFPFLIFEKDFFEQTNSWLVRGILFGFFSAIGYYLLGLTN